MLTTVHPWVGMCSVLESPVDTAEEQRASGLIVRHDDDNPWTTLKRGIIVEIAEGSNFLASGVDALSNQDVIYFTTGYKIGDIVIVNLGNIIAYEKSDGS